MKVMKRFDLKDLEKEGTQVYTRDGRKARVICTDAKVYTRTKKYPIVALISNREETEEEETCFSIDGEYIIGFESDEDLYTCRPNKKYVGYVNINKVGNMVYTNYDKIYDTEEEAVKDGKTRAHYIATTEIVWEEPNSD